jgi:NADH-quinone oxidoreductase subunit L
MSPIILIALLPLASFVVLLIAGRRARHWAHWVSAPLTAGSLALSVAAAAQVAQGAAPHVVFDWAPVGEQVFRFGLMVDPLAAVMLVVVTVVSLLVQIYSIGYMHDEPRYGWYYAVLSLFTASMLAVVLSDGYLMMYMAWEVMGLCSYLLIGFWFEDEAPQEASKKAFIVTRLGDVGFGLAVVAMFALAGTVAFDGVFASAEGWGRPAATLVALLLFCGAAGKSAQFPLHVWLPDAMAGPTPVSALIHAATMVAAGIYLVARSMPLFELSRTALTVALVVGALTALGAGLSALVANDIKKVLAYSTISQLGYMTMALGAGAPVAAMFHLTTHAFFKALLFLGSGSVIHATHTQDIREMGGLAKTMPVTAWTFLIGSVALAGIPPLSGFFSKDEILGAVLHAEGPSLFGAVPLSQVVLAVAIVTAGLTAFYMARLCFRVFFGEPISAHESPLSMTVPLLILAVPAVAAGALGFWGHSFASFVAPHEEAEAMNYALAGVSTTIAVGAIVLGALFYLTRRLDSEKLRHRYPMVYMVLSNQMFVDAFYAAAVVRPLMVACEAMFWFDREVIDRLVNLSARATVGASNLQRRFDEVVVDGLVNLSGTVVVAVAGALRRVQTGALTTYAQVMAGALVLLVVWFVLKGA